MHGITVGARIVGEPRWGAAIGIGKSPPSKSSRKPLHIRLAIRRYRVLVYVELRSAVAVQQVQSDREQLHQFARVVLICNLTSCGFVAVHHVQVEPHCGAQRYILHDGPVIRECVFRERVHVRRHAFADDGGAGGHPQFAQCERHALSQLVIASQRYIPPPRLGARV